MWWQISCGLHWADTSRSSEKSCRYRLKLRSKLRRELLSLAKLKQAAELVSGSLMMPEILRLIAQKRYRRHRQASNEEDKSKERSLLSTDRPTRLHQHILRASTEYQANCIFITSRLIVSSNESAVTMFSRFLDATAVCRSYKAFKTAALFLIVVWNLQDSVKDLSNEKELKSKMREVFRRVNKIVAQLGGYQQQVSYDLACMLSWSKSLKKSRL